MKHMLIVKKHALHTRQPGKCCQGDTVPPAPPHVTPLLVIGPNNEVLFSFFQIRNVQTLFLGNLIPIGLMPKYEYHVLIKCINHECYCYYEAAEDLMI